MLLLLCVVTHECAVHEPLHHSHPYQRSHHCHRRRHSFFSFAKYKVAHDFALLKQRHVIIN